MQIESVFAKNFRGLTFHDDLEGLRHLYTAPVGAGKSSRSMALQLLLNGTIPVAGLSKKIGDIFTTMCPAGETELRVGAVINGNKYERVLRKTKTGGASAKFYLNGDAVTKSAFEMSIFSHGIRIADLQSFIDLSPEKKQQHLLSLFPPSGDIQSVNKEISEKTELLNKYRKKGAEQCEIVKSLKTSRATLNLPAATLAELENDIAGKKAELEEFQKEMAEQRGRYQAESTNAAAESSSVSTDPVVEETGISTDPFSMSNPETAKVLDDLYAKKASRQAAPVASTASPAKCPENIPAKEAEDTAGELEILREAFANIRSALDAQSCAGMCTVNLVHKRYTNKLKKAGY